MPKVPPKPIIEAKQFTVAEIDQGIQKLKRRIDEVRELINTQVRYDDARVHTAKTNFREIIREVFGQNSPEFNDYQYYDIWRGRYTIDGDDEKQAKFLGGAEDTITILEGLIARLEEKRTDFLERQAEPGVEAKARSAQSSKRVFVVHGHDEEAKHAVARFLKQLKLEPVILSERPNEGQTIIEKFEKHSNVGYAVVLMTPDDFGYAKDEPETAHPRARQNVILELGYFVGRLTRAKVCALYKDKVETPSDFHGVLYIRMDSGDGWKFKLAGELKKVGMEVNMNDAIG